MVGFQSSDTAPDLHLKEAAASTPVVSSVPIQHKRELTSDQLMLGKDLLRAHP
jgi:hypothetical protein